MKEWKDDLQTVIPLSSVKITTSLVLQCLSVLETVSRSSKNDVELGELAGKGSLLEASHTADTQV